MAGLFFFYDTRAMETRFARRMISLAAVAGMTAATALAAHHTRKPFSVNAPAFREKGPVDAKVLIVEFSDFQCPACRYAEPMLRQLLALDEGKVRFVFKNFPLPMHQWAKNGAVAAECAGRQGKFWEYHDRLYDKQEEWTNAKADDFLAGYAQDLKLDVPAWKACVHDPATTAAIASDVKDGADAWIGSTPTFFIDGRRFLGGKQLAEIGTIFIDRELKK